MSHQRNAHVVAAATDGLAEFQAFRDAMEPSARSFEDELQALLETGVKFFRAALPMDALLLTDAPLLDDFQHVTRRTGMGPQVPVQELADWVRRWQADGRVHRTVRPESAALMLCGVAGYLAFMRLTLPEDILVDVVGPEAEMLQLLLSAFTSAHRPARLES